MGVSFAITILNGLLPNYVSSRNIFIFTEFSRLFVFFQPMNELTRLYGSVTSGLCYLLSWIVISVTMVLIHRIFQAEKKKDKKSRRGRGDQTNKLANEPAIFMFAMNQNVHLWNEMKHALLVLGLILLYLLFMTPYIVRVKVDQILQVRY